MMAMQIPLPFSPDAHENHCVSSELMMISLPWSGLVRNSLPGLNVHDIQASLSREIITEKGSEFYTFSFKT